jgi:mannose-6-phosphate isomerase
VNQIAILRNTVQGYAWGSFSFIPELLGEAPSNDRPQAELWMGAHSKASSLINRDGEWVSLADAIKQDPPGFLGEEIARTHDNQLPYLFKVLAAAKPLSLQAHPDKEQAREGFERENRLGLPLDAPTRNYRDNNHKPEVICALSPFWALHGFRPVPDLISLTEGMSLQALKQALARMKARPDSQGLRDFFSTLMTLAPETVQRTIAEVIDAAEKRIGDDAFRWVVRLHEEYPGNVGVLAPLFLNLLCLQPGEALFLPSGTLHAYLEGAGVEIMANSDNVLRGGLTSKHVDVSELLRVLSFTAESPPIIRPARGPEGDWIYHCQANEFVLSHITLEEGSIYTSRRNRSAEILLCTDGEATIDTNGASRGVFSLPKGTSAIVPAAVERYRLRGKGCLYRAGVPV